MNKISMKAARVDAQLRQRDIAKEMMVSPATVHNWETGKVVPKPAEFEMFVRLCGRSKEEITMPQKLG